MTTNSSASMWRIFVACGILIVLGGCAQTSLRVPQATSARDYPSEELRSSFGTIAIMPMYAPPEIELNQSVYDKGECAKEMAGSAVTGMMEGCSGGMGCLGLLLLTPVAAGIGAIAGAAEADTEDQVKARVEMIHARTASSEIGGRFQEKGEEVATQYDEFSLMTNPVDQNADFADIPFDLLREQGVDTVLQLGITDISSHTAEDVYCDPALSLSIRSGLRLFSSDGHPVYATSISRTSKARELEDWAKRDAQHWDDALHEFVDEVTARLVEDVFLHIDPPAQIRLVPTSSYADGSAEILIEKRPTLEWTWSPADISDWRDKSVSSHSDVTYDLRVVHDYSGLVAYEKSGLRQTTHKLEKKLRKNRNYNWQIRATFSADGKVRRTHWLGNFPAMIRR